MFTFVLYFGFLISALFVVSPLTYPVIDWFGLSVEADGWTEIWAKLLALAAFFPLIRWLRLGTLRDLGWVKSIPNKAGLVGLGLLEGLIVVGPVGLLLFVTDFRYPSADLEPLKDIGKALVAGLIGGLLIGLIEETFFRGAVWETARRRSPVVVALIVSSLFYGSVHFIQVQALPASTPWAWYNGTLEVANGLMDYFHYFDFASFTTLFVAGLLLTSIRHRDGHLYRVMGIHAGSVLVIRIMRSTTDVDHQHPQQWLAGSYDYFTGWPSTLWLSMVLAFVIWRAGGFRKLFGS